MLGDCTGRMAAQRVRCCATLQALHVLAPPLRTRPACQTWTPPSTPQLSRGGSTSGAVAIADNQELGQVPRVLADAGHDDPTRKSDWSLIEVELPVGWCEPASEMRLIRKLTKHIGPKILDNDLLELHADISTVRESTLAW